MQTKARTQIRTYPMSIGPFTTNQAKLSVEPVNLSSWGSIDDSLNRAPFLTTLTYSFHCICFVNATQLARSLSSLIFVVTIGCSAITTVDNHYTTASANLSYTLR